MIEREDIIKYPDGTYAAEVEIEAKRDLWQTIKGKVRGVMEIDDYVAIDELLKEG